MVEPILKTVHSVTEGSRLSKVICEYCGTIYAAEKGACPICGNPYSPENTKPCECEDLEKYKDFSGFGIKWAEIMRCMRNLIANTRDYPEIQKGEE